ncbi:HalX domain-containing protein [Halobacteriales archaeon Cl-PHB]
MTARDSAAVVVLAATPSTADDYADMLRPEYAVETAADAGAALSLFVDGPGEVLVVERRLADDSGTRVVDRLRARQVDPGVVLVTDADPDLETIERGVDEHLARPVTAGALRTVVAEVLDRAAYTDALAAYRTALTEMGELEATLTDAELAAHDRYQELAATVRDLETHLDDDEDLLVADAEFVGAIREAGEDVPADAVADDDPGGDR